MSSECIAKWSTQVSLALIALMIAHVILILCSCICSHLFLARSLSFCNQTKQEWKGRGKARESKQAADEDTEDEAVLQRKHSTNSTEILFLAFLFLFSSK